VRDYLHRLCIVSALLWALLADDGPKGYNDLGTAAVFALVAIALRKERP
jgi:hypothetical protein